MTPQASYLTTLMTHPTSPGKKSDAPVPPLPPPLRRGKGVTLDVSASRWSDLGHLEPWTRRARAEASEKGELVLGRWEKMGGRLGAYMERIRRERAEEFLKLVACHPR